MKFRTRIIMVYFVFVLSMAVLLGGIFYYSSVKSTVNQELQNLNDLARQLNQQYEDSITSMKNVSNYILSDSDALEAIQKLSKFSEDADSMSVYFSEAGKEVRSVLNTDYIIRNFYRVIFFNENGVVVSTVHEERKLNQEVKISTLPWIAQMKDVAYGDFEVLGLHEDDWGKRKQNVFSVVKELQGNKLGYIEVQKTEEDLAALFEISNPNVKIMLLDREGNLLFSNAAYEGDGGYQAFFEQKIISKENGATLIVAKGYDTIKKNLHYIFTMTLTLAGSIIGLAIIYILVTSNHLTKPMQELTQLMEQTDLDNIAEDVGLKTSNNEIKLLSQSYENMLRRLDTAILKEKRISMIQFQAQFDALQAQVNPHFIYNILNVISSRGVLHDDDTICEICDELAAMLRYSTNIKERHATVEQEAVYLKAYISLLKCRYEHKLEYHIEFDPEIMHFILPKLVLQQLAENSISHGYESEYQIMKIEVSGWLDATGWYIRIRDNGDGFSAEALTRVRNEINKMKQQISSIQKNVELEIGGMGIANAFARLYLLYQEQLIYTIDNYEQGAEVLLGVLK